MGCDLFLYKITECPVTNRPCFAYHPKEDTCLVKGLAMTQMCSCPLRKS